MKAIKDLFYLDPEVAFLNHGSFGATPRPVLEAYQQWQRALERQPVQFIITELFDHLAQARQALGAYVRADPFDLAFVPNVTFAANLVARSLYLQPGDEILTTDHEYGGCENALRFVCLKTGANLRRQAIPLPLPSDEEMLDRLWAGVTPQTRAVFVSHITSSTAVRFPVEDICRRAREAGLLVVVDGAHAPGQIPLDLEAIGADFYLGNCHKWLCAPKGAGFLHARPERQAQLEPLVVSWGWGADPPFDAGSPFLNNMQWWGTIDPSAWLSVPAAIEFQEQHDWPSVQGRCQQMLATALEQVNALTGLPPLAPDGGASHLQMGVAQLPPLSDLPAAQAELYRHFKVEVPLLAWNDLTLLRVSVQGYNTRQDIDRLIEALSVDTLPPSNRTTF